MFSAESREWSRWLWRTACSHLPYLQVIAETVHLLTRIVHVNQRNNTDDMIEELGFQKLMLDTLDPDDEDYEPTKALIIQEVEKLQARLAAIKQKKKAVSNVPLQGPFKLAAASSTNKKSSDSPAASSDQAPEPRSTIPTSFRPSSSSNQSSSNNFSKNNHSSIDPFSGMLILSTSSPPLCTELSSASTTP